MTKQRSITLEKPKPFKITHKIITEALVRDARLFEQEALRDYAKNNEWGIIHSSEQQYTINGYCTDQIVGSTAKTFGINTNISLAPAGFVENILGVYADIFHRIDISLMGAEELLTKVVPPHTKCAVLNLGGVSSSLSWVDQGVLQSSNYFHGGLEAIEAFLAQIFAVNRRNIDALMKFASDEHLLEHEQDVYYRRIESAYRVFGNEIRSTMISIKKSTGFTPEVVYVIASPQWATLMKPLLEADLDVPVVMVHASILDDSIIMTHEARVQNVILSLAVTKSLDSVHNI
jgi:hypothetical protein